MGTIHLTPKSGKNDINLWNADCNFYAILTYKPIFKLGLGLFKTNHIHISNKSPFKMIDNSFQVAMDCARLSEEDFNDKYIVKKCNHLMASKMNGNGLYYLVCEHCGYTP